MKPISAEFLANACGGKLIGNPNTLIKGIKIDSRDCAEGDMFVCVVGENRDGHDFIASAFVNGCNCFLVSHEVEFSDACFILVEDTKIALTKMAEAYLNQYNLIKVGVTGSVGKTTTKMLTAAVLSSKYNTVCTQKNLNTDLGAALTAFSADDQTEAIVFEMGMDGPGQIAELVKWIKPSVALISNIGVSHLERLGSREAIADAKLEIVSEFNESSILIVNGNSDFLKSHNEIRERAKNKSAFSIFSIGQDILLEDIKNNGAKGIEFKVNGVDISLPLIGEHNAIDAALAVTCGMQFGISINAAAKALLGVAATDKRLKVEDIDGITLIDDSYNASPDSMRAAISAISGVHARRRILVLSDMLELGSAEEAGHIAVGRYAAEMGIDMILATGAKKDYYRQGVLEVNNATCIYKDFENNEAIESYLDTLLKKDDAILVKGSNSTKVSKVAEYIRNKNV